MLVQRKQRNHEAPETLATRRCRSLLKAPKATPKSRPRVGSERPSRHESFLRVAITRPSCRRAAKSFKPFPSPKKRKPNWAHESRSFTRASTNRTQNRIDSQRRIHPHAFEALAGAGPSSFSTAPQGRIAHTIELTETTCTRRLLRGANVCCAAQKLLF